MIRSPVDFLPSRIRLLMNFATVRSWNLGSGRIFRFSTTRRRGIEILCLARALGAVLRAALLAALDADGVEGPADDVVANAGKVLDAAAADEHHRVLLEVVADAGDVARDLEAVGQADARHLPEGRVRLLRGGGVDARGHATLLGRLHEGGSLPLGLELLAALADQLADRRHSIRFFPEAQRADPVHQRRFPPSKRARSIRFSLGKSRPSTVPRRIFRAPHPPL